jgi:hypothetical protein
MASSFSLVRSHYKKRNFFPTKKVATPFSPPLLQDSKPLTSLFSKNASNLSEDLVNEECDDQEDLMHVPLINFRKKVRTKGSRVSVRRSSRIKKLKNLF